MDPPHLHLHEVTIPVLDNDLMAAVCGDVPLAVLQELWALLPNEEDSLHA